MINFYLCPKTKKILLNFDNDLNIDGLELLKANIKEAATEKHLPVVKRTSDGLEVEIGEVMHPMDDEHYITMIYLETKCGGQVKALTPKQSPKAVFKLASDDEPIAVYEYCTLHGLWKTEV